VIASSFIRRVEAWCCAALLTALCASSEGAASSSPGAGQTPKPKPPVKIEVAEDGALRMDQATNIAYADKDVVLSYGDLRLTADHVRYNTVTRDAWAEGNVHLYRGGSQWTGESLYYNFDTEKAVFGKFRVFAYPWFIRGEQAERVGAKYVVRNGVITTCDYEDPHWGFRAKTIEFFPDDKIVARGVTLRIGDTPVFYFPYVSKSLTQEKSGFEIVPGSNSRFGPYLLVGYNWYVDKHLSGTLHADYRARRGFATGVDVDYSDPVVGFGDLKTYMLYDRRPNSQTWENPEENVRNERYRVWWRDQTPLREDMVLKVDLKKQSDSRVIEDFFRSEFKREVQPDSVIELSKYDPGYSISVMMRPHLNSFYTTTERLPDLAIDIKRQQLFGSPIYYQGELSAVNLRKKHSNLLSPEPEDFGAVRFDWLHQVLYPNMYFGWLSVVPRAGIRETWYSRTPEMMDAAGDYEGNSGQATRWTFPVGVESSFKLSRVYDVNDAFFDVHGLRHIIQPVVDFTYVPKPNKEPEDLYQFDTTGRFNRNMYTSRLLFNDFPAFDQVDAIDRLTAFRAGVRNKLQTKRDGVAADFVNLNLYGEWRGSPYRGQRSLSDLYVELESQPLRWMGLDLDARVSDRGDINELNASIRFIKERQFEIAVGRRYIKDYDGAIDGDSDYYTLMTHFVVTENWAVRTAHAFEARSGVLQEQEYTIVRDMHDWEMALRFRHLEDSDNNSEFDVMLLMTLKAFPKTSFDVGF
jgi:lipopolysaccharide assembly outer membrane protein LptD (OstA)